MSARKMRMVAEIIRGKRVDEALQILRYTKKEGSLWMEKLLLSAVANWEDKTQSAAAEDYDLVVKTLLVDEAGMIKRFRPAPHGRANRIRKRSNHVTMVVSNLVPFDSDYNQEEE